MRGAPTPGAAGLAATVVVLLLAGLLPEPAAAAGGQRLIVRVSPADKARSPTFERVLLRHDLSLGAPVFRGHPDWGVYALRGDGDGAAMTALRRVPGVVWAEWARDARTRTRPSGPFPIRRLETAPRRLGAAALPPRAPRRAAAVPDPPTGCAARAGLAQGQPNDPLYCGESTNPLAFYAEEWNNFCFLPAAQRASVLGAAPRAPEASGMCSDAAWRLGAQGQGTVIAILDSGVNYNHEDLRGRMVDETIDPRLRDPRFPGTASDGRIHGWNFYDDNAEPMDFDGHGTGRAGIAAAEADNGKGMAGVAPRARIMAVKVGDTYVVHSENVAQGIVYAADHGADVINTSLGATGNSRLLRMAAVYAHERGVFFAAATANEYSTHHNYPTNLDTVAGIGGLGPDNVAVLATTCQTTSPPAGCTPASPQKTFLQKVNYANFGAIQSFATPIDTPSTSRSGGYGLHASGTSTAAPHAAGAAALVRSAGYLGGLCAGHVEIDGAFTAPCTAPVLSANEVRQLMAYTATRVRNDEASAANYPANPSGDPTAAGGEFYPQQGGDPHLGWNIWSGYGRPNLYAATAYAREGLVPPEVQLYGDTPPPGGAFEGLAGPIAFGVYDPARTPELAIVGHVASRPLPAGQYLEWRVQVAPCLEPQERDFQTVATGRGGRDGVLARWRLPQDASARCAAGGRSRPFNDPGTHTLRVVAEAHLDGDGSPVAVPNPVAGRDPNRSLPPSGPLRGQDRRVVYVRHSPADRPGTPLYLGSSGEASPILYDLEGRGELDVIEPTADGEVQAVRPDGTPLPGWPARADTLSASGYSPHPAAVAGEPPVGQLVGSAAVGDLDADGQPDVVAASFKGGVYAWRRDGRRVPGFPVPLPPPPVGAAPADPFGPASPDDDYCLTRHPAVFEQRGSDYGSIAAPVLADLDGARGLEIVQAAGNGCVYALRADGSLMWSYRPRSLPGTPLKIAATPAVGDLDGDGDPDIVIGTEEVSGSVPLTRGRLYAVDGRTRELLPGWPAELPSTAAAGVPTVATGVISSPALFPSTRGRGLQVATGAFFQGDPQNPAFTLNADGTRATTLRTEAAGAGSNTTDLPFHYGVTQTAVGRLGSAPAAVVTGGFGAFLAVDTAAVPGKKSQFQHEVGAFDAASGAPLATFPRQIEDWQFLSGPALADVRGNGRAQVIAGSGAGFVHAFDPDAAVAGGRENLSTSLSRYNDLAEPAGFPVQTGGYITSTPAVAQLTRGGPVTVATVTRDGFLFLTETGGRPEANDQWWRFHHDERNTGLLGLDTRPPATVTDLRGETGARSGEAVAIWTATGDDWWVGRAGETDLRWSTEPITDEGFARARRVPTESPAESGRAERVTVTGLAAGRRVHLAQRAVDDAGNTGLIARTTVTAGGTAAASRNCLPRRLRVTSGGIGRVRLRQSAASVVRRAGLPARRGRTSLRYCVRGGGRVTVALTSPRGRARLVVTTARGHRAGRVRVGARSRGLRGTRDAGRGLLRSGRYVYGVRRGRVRYLAVADRALLRSPRLLRRYLRRVRP